MWVCVATLLIFCYDYTDTFKINYGNLTMNFVLIILSGVLDIFANLALQKSNGFRKVWWGILALVLVGSAFLLLAVVVDNGMSLPIAYTLWGTIGILGSVTGAYYFFKQKLKPIGYVGIVLVIIAVALLQLKF
ncbi:SMR family transporter [Helicobacter trogontum]|uniref:Spermidine export protein MdtI n=2 Tax=Helicobacter trogontum TaxID=50960 RepID=A0ABQ0D5E2_9HELI